MLMKKQTIIIDFSTSKELFLTGETQQMNIHKIKQLQQSTIHQDKYKPSLLSNQHIKYHPLCQYKNFLQKTKILHKADKNQKSKLLQPHIRNLKLKTLKRPIPISISLFSKQNAKNSNDNNRYEIYDWMMEFSSLLKLSKNTYYCSIVIIQKILQVDPKIFVSKHIHAYVCSALAIAAKYQNSRQNYIDSVVFVNEKRLPKYDIVHTQNQVLKKIKWILPKIVVQQQLSQLMQKWDAFALGEFGGQSNFQKLLILKNNLLSNSYVEIVYVFDYIVIKKHRQFLTATKFKLPILIAMYISLSLCVGDRTLTQNYLWKYFSKFIKEYSLLKQDQIPNFKKDAICYFNQLQIGKALVGMPLKISFYNSIEKHEQIYIQTISDTL